MNDPVTLWQVMAIAHGVLAVVAAIAAGSFYCEAHRARAESAIDSELKKDAETNAQNYEDQRQRARDSESYERGQKEKAKAETARHVAKFQEVLTLLEEFRDEDDE